MKSAEPMSMGRKVGIAVAGVVLLGMIIWPKLFIHTETEPDEIAAVPAVTENRDPAGDAPKDRLDEQAPDQKADRQEADVAILEASEKGAEEQRRRIMRNMAENLQNPGMNQIIAQQQRILIENKYTDLMKALGLNEAESAHFLDLLTARQMLQVDMGMKLMTGVLSPEEKRSLVEKLEKDTKPINEEIDYFLNDADDSEYLKFYEQTEMERSAISGLAEEARRNNVPVDEDLQEELVALVYEEMNNHSFTMQFAEGSEPDFSQFTDENISRHVEEMNALSEVMLQRASELLEPEQLLLFEKTYRNYVSSQEQRMRMIQQLF